MTDPWPLRSSLELGALSTAVPCACLHVKHVLWEWGLNSLAESAELLVSELVSNAVNATGVLIEVRDADPSHHKPGERTTTARATVPTACSWWRPSAPAGTGTSPRNPRARSSGASWSSAIRARPKPQAEIVTDLDILRRLRDHLMS